MGIVDILVGVIAVAALGAGLTLTTGASGPTELVWARACFAAAAVAVATAYFYWLGEAPRKPVARIPVGVVIGLAVMVGTPELFRWTFYRQGLLALAPLAEPQSKTATQTGKGGKGGGGTVVGDRATIVTGRGGKGGIGGNGGDGGTGVVHGDDAVIIGGDGGDAGQPDGRGGNGGASGYQRAAELGLLPTELRVSELIGRLRHEYILSHDGITPAMMAGTAPLPDDWTNQRLKELGVPYHYEGMPTGYRLTAIPPASPASAAPQP